METWLPRTALIKNYSLPIGWLISFKNPINIWNDHWFALVCELCIFAVFLIAYKHALGRGPRETCFLFGCFFGSFGLEVLQQIPNAGYQLWWYHQGMVNLLQRRIPLYTACSVGVMGYYSDYLTRKLNLPHFTQSMVKATVGVLLAVPCLCIASNYLLVMVHFDDPLFRERLLNIPYVQLAHWFLMLFHLKHLFKKSFEDIEDHERNVFGYLKCAFETGFLSGFYSLLEVYLLHLVIALIFYLPVSFIVPVGLSILAFFACREIRNTDIGTIQLSGLSTRILTKEFLGLCVFYSTILCIAILVPTENLKSYSERIELGPCDAFETVTNVSPLPVRRRQYICPNDTNVEVIRFSCLADAVQNISGSIKEYPLCATPVHEKMKEYLAIYSVCCLMVFYLLLSVTFGTHRRNNLPVTKKLE